MTISERVLILIKNAGMTDIAISKEIGLTRGVITQWKQKKQNPSLEAVSKMAEYFDVSTDYIIFGKKTNNDLTEEENELLEYFNNCDPINQGFLLGYAKGLAGQKEVYNNNVDNVKPLLKKAK